MNPYEEAQLASFWNQRFMNAMVAKSDYTKRWQRYIDAYDGEYFKNSSQPEYKSNQVSNYIFSIIETIRPIMLDNDPKFQALARQPEGLMYSTDLHEALSYEWDREEMNVKLYRELINTLRIGTSVFFVPWDAQSRNVRAIPINAFSLFPDPLATTVEDAEYLIYATYKHEGILQRLFPKHAKRLRGGSVKYSELVNDNDKNSQIDNQILTLECWARDYSMDEFIDGDVKKTRPKYPNGRVITICPELNLVLSDKENPYADGNFPIILIKDYDVPGKFWGEGEVQQLLSPQTYMNELNNSIIDNAKHTANMAWIIDKNSGIGQGKLTNRPGIVVRKNPGTEVRRDQPPSMPAYVQNTVDTMKGDMEQISGVFDTLKGNSETGVYTAQGILALQEAGQARIRLKVKILEQSLGKLATMWYSRMRQFWKDDRFIRITRFDGSYDLKKIRKDALKYECDIRITAGSTMAVNRGAMLDLMIRLAQTQMPDGQPLVDRMAVAEYLPEEIKGALMRRMAEQQNTLDDVAQQVETLSEEQQTGTEQTMGTIEQLVGAVEKLNAQILQLQQEHAKMLEEQKVKEKEDKIRTQSYNEGYGDAEKMMQVSDEDTALPDEVLSGLEELSDDELELLLMQNPQLADLIK